MAFDYKAAAKLAETDPDFAFDAVLAADKEAATDQGRRYLQQKKRLETWLKNKKVVEAWFEEGGSVAGELWDLLRSSTFFRDHTNRLIDDLEKESRNFEQLLKRYKAFPAVLDKHLVEINDLLAAREGK